MQLLLVLAMERVEQVQHQALQELQRLMLVEVEVVPIPPLVLEGQVVLAVEVLVVLLLQV
jgi:hypothetical protein